jgi:transketolase
MTRQDAMTLRAIDSPVDGHPTRRWASPSSTPPPARSAGPERRRRVWPPRRGWTSLDRNVYCIIGDGESREGQIWEASTSLSSTA